MNLGLKKRHCNLPLVPDTDDVKQKNKSHETISNRVFPEQKTKRSFALRHVCPVHKVKAKKTGESMLGEIEIFSQCGQLCLWVVTVSCWPYLLIVIIEIIIIIIIVFTPCALSKPLTSVSVIEIGKCNSYC